MSTYRTRNIWNVGLLVAGALVLAVPADAQRFSRSRGGDDSKSDSRSESRSDSRSETRSSTRSESRPAPSTPSRSEPRGDNSSSRSNTGGSSRWQPTAPTQTPAPGPTWRGGGNTTNTSPSPAWRGNTSNTPSTPPSANEGRFSPNPVGSANRDANPNYRSENPNYRSEPSQPAPRYGGGASRGNPNWRPGTGPNANDNTSNTPATPTRPSNPTRPGGIGNGGNSGGSANNGGWTRPGGIGNNGGISNNGTKDGDIGDGTSTPPVRPGGVTPTRPGSSGSPVASWRAPDRGRMGGTTSGRGAPGASGTRGSIGSAPNRSGSISSQRPGSTSVRPGIAGRKPTYITPSVKSRPPRVDRNRWLDGTRHFGGRDFNIVPLGFYDPWACYNASSPWFTDVRFYYPYYYIGPYYNGFYYSPFYIYGSWFPTYIYPERIIYVERRVYLRDVVSDDDYYDPYGADVQFSLRDTMDDLKSAWLEGEGGRLLQHVNAAVPVRVYQKGVYKYSLEPEDYRDITKDALNRVDTIGFEWIKIDKNRSDEVTLIAKHTFRDPDGDQHSIRLTYTLEKARGSWWITETGTSAWNGDI